MRRYGFQSSCKSKIPPHVFSQHIPLQFPLFLINFTSVRLVLMALVVCNSHSCVSKLCKSKQRTVNVWMNGFGLFWVLWHFFLVAVLYILLWGRGVGWHLLQYCDDYLKIVNCTEFTIILFVLSVGIPYKICILWLFFVSLSDCGKSDCTAPEFILPSALFSFFRAIIKRNLKTVNKYYCVEIWMSLQKCIWMS